MNEFSFKEHQRLRNHESKQPPASPPHPDSQTLERTSSRDDKKRSIDSEHQQHDYKRDKQTSHNEDTSYSKNYQRRTYGGRGRGYKHKPRGSGYNFNNSGYY